MCFIRGCEDFFGVLGYLLGILRALAWSCSWYLMISWGLGLVQLGIGYTVVLQGIFIGVCSLASIIGVAVVRVHERRRSVFVR